jgi:hypothetical protein
MLIVYKQVDIYVKTLQLLSLYLRIDLREIYQLQGSLYP